MYRDEAGDYWLITPAERGRITVDDVPFVAVSADQDGSRWIFRTNVGDEVVAGDDHAIVVRHDDARHGPRPYIHVRGGLNALIARPVYYQLADAMVDEDGRFGVWSDGVFFPLEPTGSAGEARI